MTALPDLVTAHHRAIGEALTGHLQRLTSAGADADASAFVRFVDEELLPHTDAEERVLYPAVAELLAVGGDPTAAMRIDHEAIRAQAEQFRAAAQWLEGAPADERARRAAELVESAVRLDAIVRLRLRKEEVVYLPLVAERLPAEQQARLAAALHEDAPSHQGEVEQGGMPVLDVRSEAPARRHALIFDWFAGLQPGAAFVLVNDHDPKPLYYQFAAEHSGEFTWRYLEQGPEVWRVELGRTG